MLLATVHDRAILW